jgi:hypothetical protein
MADEEQPVAPPVPPVEHHGFACDRSGMDPIVGIRYTKPSAENGTYDLCQAEFDKISSPEERAEYTAITTPQVVHYGFACDRSGQCPIIGVRYSKISNEDDSCDLCQAEYDKITSAEERAQYMAITTPVEQDEEDDDEDEDEDEDEEGEAGPLNEELCDELESVFKPLGIVAFSRCCRWGCTGSYDEEDPNWCEKTGRQKGIYYIRLHLDGMNYDPAPECCFAMYSDFEYTMNHWDEECELLMRFCRIVYGDEKNGKNSRFRIEKPENESRGIGIFFEDPLTLQPMPADEEEDEDEDEDEEEEQEKEAEAEAENVV